jgi:hypothetical protein
MLIKKNAILQIIALLNKNNVFFKMYKLLLKSHLKKFMIKTLFYYSNSKTLILIENLDG